MKKHRLKTANPYFSEAWYGNKPFECVLDEDFEVGDLVEIFEYDPQFPEQVTNTREIHGQIAYILKGLEGVKEGYCIFSYRETNRYMGSF